MKAPKGILMLVEVNSTKPNCYGNREHFGTVTNTRTGQSLTFIMETDSNTAVHVADALRKVYPNLNRMGYIWDALKVTHHEGIPTREFQRRTKNMAFEYRVNFEALVTGKGEVLKPAPGKK